MAKKIFGSDDEPTYGGINFSSSDNLYKWDGDQLTKDED